MNPVHVAIYHDAIIPPRRYGGTERAIAYLARGLLERGHSVTLLSRPGGYVEGASFIPVQPGRPLSEDMLPSGCDIVHVFSTPSRPLKRPHLITIQGNGKPGERFHPNTVFVSRKHAENHGSRHFVHNGIDVDEYPCDTSRSDHLVFLAKASWKVKNLAGAIELARAAKMPLDVMGSRDLPLRLNRLLPALGGIRYRGMLDDQEKKPILRSARALLFPVLWDEPFGVAVIEAMASGCAVFGTPYGSLPEIVTPETGALSADASVLLERLRSERYSPESCRKRVLENFTYLHMTDKYLSYYEWVLKAGCLGDASEPAPRAQFKESPETLLPWKSLGR
jgi:hypothetical protein